MQKSVGPFPEIGLAEKLMWYHRDYGMRFLKRAIWQM